MSFFECTPVCFHHISGSSNIVFENEFVQWIHSGQSGQLIGATVKNGSGENLLTEPFLTRICCIENDENIVYTAGKNAVSVQTDDQSIRSVHRFFREDGKELAHFRMEHEIRYGEFGEGSHTVRLIPERPLTNVTSLQPVIFGVRDNMNQLGIRDRYANSPGYWSSNPVRWQMLHGGRKSSDVQPLLINHLPLSLLFLKTGSEGIQLELGDDLDVWEPFPGYQEGAVLHNVNQKGYTIRLSSFLARQNETLSQPVTLSFRLTLPFVRKNIVPFRRAAPLFLFERGFEQRWPGEEDFAELSRAGFDLLRLHCDCDYYHNGVFWRGAVYPPFPPEEMQKMEQCIHSAHRYGIHIVPYFSVKEMHPDAEGFDDHALEWAHLSTKESSVGISKFGAVMCLESSWNIMRREMIRKPLESHDFDGIYYDWCGGIECHNQAHFGHTHWDNDRLLDHFKWTCDTFGGKQKERYIHQTFTPSLAVENVSTMTITEETEYPAFSPEMFSPHVHFLNIAPRQICDMLPKNATDHDRRKLAMCALLHHASVSSQHPVYLDFYAQLSWLDSVTRYEKHAAPGENIIFSDDPKIGFSIYWNSVEMLVVGANLSDSEKDAEFRIALPGRGKFTGRMKLPPLTVSTRKIQ